MARTALGMLAGLVTWVALWALANLAMRGLWSAYAAAFPYRAFTLTMLLVRLAIGTIVTVAAGATAAWLAKGERKAALWFGLLLLLVVVVDHIHIWYRYPVWYHLLAFAGFVPLAMLGGKLGQRHLCPA